MAESCTTWNVSNPVNIRGKLPLKWCRFFSISSICICTYTPRTQLTPFFGRVTFNFMGWIFQNMGHLGQRQAWVCNLIPLLVPIDVVIFSLGHWFDWFWNGGMVPDGALVVSWPCKNANKKTHQKQHIKKLPRWKLTYPLKIDGWKMKFPINTEE